MDFPNRKRQRLKDYDYSMNNSYFVTICTQNRDVLFGDIMNKSIFLSKSGKMISEKFLNITETEGVKIDKYVVMPNHIHAIITISYEETKILNNGINSNDGTKILNNGTTQGSFPTLSELIQRFKTITTKLYIDGVKEGIYQPFNKKIWQKSFYDHIIRNENEYKTICNYIEHNPQKWEEDFYNVGNDPCVVPLSDISASPFNPEDFIKGKYT